MLFHRRRSLVAWVLRFCELVGFMLALCLNNYILPCAILKKMNLPSSHTIPPFMDVNFVDFLS